MSDTFTSSRLNDIDWDALTEKIECPLCLYNLRGLIEPRCPECGYRFEWAELLDPHRRRHPYLFEHHPKRNIRSFLRTLVGGLRPLKFWNQLNPAQSLSVKRLVIYWLLCSSFLLLAPVVEVMKIAVHAARVNANSRSYPVVIISGYPPQQFGSSVATAAPMPPSQAFFRQVWQQLPYYPVVYSSCLTVMTILLWPLLTFAALMIFQASMRKAKIRSAHVLRCVVYSADASIWYVLLVFTALVALFVLAALQSHVLENWTPEEVAAWLIFILCLVQMVRLTIAYGSYLRFDRPFLTILASQIIAALAMGGLFFWGGRLFGVIDA
jgi:hypothetical protein